VDGMIDFTLPAAPSSAGSGTAVSAARTHASASVFPSVLILPHFSTRYSATWGSTLPRCSGKSCK